MVNFQSFYAHLEEFGLSQHAEQFRSTIDRQFTSQRYSELEDWLSVFEALPSIKSPRVELKSSVSVGEASDLGEKEIELFRQALQRLIPWRKGPYSLFGINIDTEWRSDWKWDRVLPHIHPLDNRKVLDVGCGSGYHCWRMLGEGAKWVLGIEPSPRFVLQFETLKFFQKSAKVDVIPLGIEHLPKRLNYFDTTFSMGVLYHRSSPIDHLKELRDTLRPGGELVLETLVVDGKKGEILVPDDRYAQMRNVWFLPSVPSLLQWLERCGFEQARCVDLNQTSTEEQRSTEWMPSHSLKEFLDPQNPNLTIEGYPAPLRAVVIAKRKGGN